jgi:hypothetical protein
MLQAAAEVVLNVVCGATGHGLLWVLTLGRWKAFEGPDELATIVGLLFWVVAGVGVALLLLMR